MATIISPLTSQRLGVPTCIGKRSRSNSASSFTSSTSSSAGASSIFSNSHSGVSVDSLSSCSSPQSEKASPPTSASSSSDDERPSKSLRTAQLSDGPLAIASSSTVEEDVAALNTLEKRCTLSVSSAGSHTDEQRITPSPPITTAGAGKSVFVDCLVDATVHVLNMIWNAPVHKSIAFLENVRSVSSSKQYAEDDTCRCPVGSPVPGGIPLDLFVRETLRRSRTSCSTLQAALLYCKRVGYEVVRKRAETEGVSLSDDQENILCVGQRDYPSLSKSLDDTTKATLPIGISADPILCSRRTFLASIMISSKFLQDRTFSNRAWSKISGLNVKELGIVERRLLSAIEFDLSVVDSEWQAWTRFLKGEWKAKISSCQCNSGNTSIPAAKDVVDSPTGINRIPVTLRKALERTTSLNIDTAVDMEIPPPREVDVTSPNCTPSATFCDDSCTSTPTQEKRLSLTNTPTKSTFIASTHKRDSSLLATALTNRMVESSAHINGLDSTPVPAAVNTHLSGSSFASSSTNEMALPFPLRKGLAIRSISTRS